MPKLALVAAATGEAWEGIVAFEGQETGDGRLIEPGAIRWENGPWPLVFDIAENDHTGMVVGTVDEIWREGDTVLARGHLSETENREVAAAVGRVRELLDEGAVGVSVRLDDIEMPEPEGEPDEEPDPVLVVSKARVRHVAIVDTPAFDAARIVLSETEPVSVAASAGFYVSGTANLPVADRKLPWHAAEAKKRVFEHCGKNVACISRAFLWREPDMDPREPEAWSLGYADVVDGRLQIVPRGIAQAAGGRGVGAKQLPEGAVDRVYAKITSVYDRVREIYDDWPLSPFRDQIALVAAADPAWFADPAYGDETDPRLVWQEPERPEEVRQLGAPLTVTDEGRIAGHAALFGRCHLGYAGTCVRPPKESDAYRGFLTGERVPGVPTGPLVFKTTHASLKASAEEAQRHYHDTGQAVADVTVGSDEYGIWAAGAVRPDASENDIEVLRGSALSGDWRSIGGRLRLVGLLVVNAPGFRVARAMAASAALITSGPGCEVCGEERSLEDRVETLERLMAESLVAGL